MIDELEETASFVAISRLQAAYGDVVTRRRWDLLDPLFAPDAPVVVDTVSRPPIELHGAAALGAFIAEAVDRFEFFEFVVLNAVVSVDASDVATGRVYIAELRQARDTGEWTNAFGVYHDRYERAGGRWRFAARRYQSLARTAPGARAAVFPFPEGHPPA